MLRLSPAPARPAPVKPAPARPAPSSPAPGAGPLLAALVVVLGASAIPARAQTVPDESGGFYLGLSLPVGSFGATMHKAVDNTASNTLVPEPRRGRVFRDEVTGNGLAYGLALTAGYRLPLAGDAFYLDGEVGAGWNGGSLEAQFAGVGVSSERKQLGESWPDVWTVEKPLSYGATVRVGGRPGVLRARNLSVYLMAGVGFADVRLRTDYDGCFSPEPCEAAEFESGTETLDFDFSAWVGGVGMERHMSERIAVRVEATYASHGREEWVTPFADVGVTVDSHIDAHETGLTLSVVRRF